MVSDSEIGEALKRYWGYDSFRPGQERIVRTLLEARDACVVMPTGGGKSLCYQLPAALLWEKTAVVISPLIALMQDQVAQLTQMGIPAAVLNSSLTSAEQKEITRGACTGKYDLLYLSPERLVRADTFDWLQRVPISFFVIDEAHCISEWGHEFRPEYRQLSRLRAEFPGRPIAAFTASATKRVRHDIVDQLQLQDPDKYIASFYRPNLNYIVRECKPAEQLELMVRAIRRHAEGHVIVYSPTIARVAETVTHLEQNGIAAVGYHGQLDADARRRNQERWMADEVRVLVGTIAFGLGINKASVRAVIHLSLPKAIEQYYQEAGRAGRDGLPSDCLLLWQKRDAGLLGHFIGEIQDPAEKERAWQRYHSMRRFVDSKSCRHRQICVHFGEIPNWDSCGACDICGCGSEWLSQPMQPVQPVHSVRPVQPAKPAHAVQETQPTRRTSRIRKRSRAAQAPVGEIDPGLREHLREWRRVASKEQSVPAFVVMHDTSLDELCRRRPRTLRELLQVSGFGERKVAMYGEKILLALKQYGASKDR